MSYSQQAKSGSASARVQILTVDTANRRIEALNKDNSTLQVSVWDDAGNAFRWPKENEIWIVRRVNGVWFLDSRVQQGQVGADNTTVPEPVPITAMSPGELKLDGAVVIDSNGYTFIAVDLTGISNGWTIKWNSTLNRFVAGP